MFKHIVFATLISMSTATVVAACSCLPIPLAEQFESSSDVFIGKVLGIEALPPECVGAFGVQISFEKTGYWKGDASNVAHVRTGCSDGLCGIDFESDVEYVVFSAFDDSLQILYPGICGGTVKSQFAAEALAFLGPALTPVGARGISWSTIKAKY
jgi:hypothetical protein